MSQIVQFRCPSCLKCLVKYDKSTNKVTFRAEGLYEEGKDGNAYKLLCPKCDTWSAIKPSGLEKIEDPYKEEEVKVLAQKIGQ